MERHSRREEGEKRRGKGGSARVEDGEEEESRARKSEGGFVSGAER